MLMLPIEYFHGYQQLADYSLPEWEDLFLGLRACQIIRLTMGTFGSTTLAVSYPVQLCIV